MFVGFIAVVVILLVIVGLMSSGATNGSGGVDQTKATKALSEISALVQSTGFFKTTTANSDYTGISVTGLNDAGIIADADIVTAEDANVSLIDDNSTEVTGNRDLIKSKSVSGLFYEITEGTSVNSFKIEIIADSSAGAITDGTKKALESAYTKLSASAVDIQGDKDSKNNFINTYEGTGAGYAEFN